MQTKTTGILEDQIQQDQLMDLAEQLKLLLSESQLSASHFIIEVNHKIGELIVNNPLYKKHSHGSGRFIKQLAVAANKSEQHLYLCIKFYEKYPEVSNALETLQPDEKKLTWRHVAATLFDTEEKDECEHAPENLYIVKFQCCRSCGTRIKELK